MCENILLHNYIRLYVLKLVKIYNFKILVDILILIN